MFPFTVLTSRSASRRSGSSTVADPLTVTTFTSPVSPKACMLAWTGPFTEIARTGPLAVRASTPPFTDTPTTGAEASTTWTDPFTVVAPSATPLGRCTTNSIATSFPFMVVGFHSDPGAHWVACWPQSAHTVSPAPLWSAMTLTDVGSE